MNKRIDPGCINVREKYSDSYRITFDEAYDPANVPRDKLDPWMMQLPCKGGITIYPVGGDILAVEVDYHRHVATALRIMGLQVHQDGAREQTFLFAAADFDRVAAVVKPGKRRRLTEAQKQAAARRLSPYRFVPQESGR